MANSTQYLHGVTMIALASVLWGTTGTAASLAPAVSPLAIGAFAMGGSGVLMLLYSIRLLLKDRHTLQLNARLVLIGAISVALYPLAFYSAMRLSGVAIGTVVSIASAPLFAVVLECLISKKRISLDWVISFLTGGLGILLLSMGKISDSSLSTPGFATVGALLGLVAGLTYAIYSWSAKRLIEQGVHAQSAMAAMFGLAAAALLPSLVLTGDNLFANTTHTSVALYMALVPMFVGYWCFSFGLRHVDASRATLITLLEPVVAVVLAVLVVGERFLAIGWLGVGMILLSLLFQVVGAGVAGSGSC